MLSILAVLAMPQALNQGGAELAVGLVGKQARSVVLKDEFGKDVDLSKVFGKQPVVLVFYRGDWCPICHRQFSQLHKWEQQFLDRKATIYAISVEPAARLKAMRDGESLGKAFVFLSDPQAKLAQLYVGKEVQGYLKPATIVVGKNGKITFATSMTDISVRPSPITILKAIGK